jgi:rhodanese-related sulfurtransferase
VNSGARRIAPRELRDRLARGDDLVLLDVREPHEFEIARLSGSVLIPRGELSRRLDELDPERTIVCICHHGIRSLQAAAFLRTRDFPDVMDLEGGIDRWSIEVDPALPRYGN